MVRARRAICEPPQQRNAFVNAFLSCSRERALRNAFRHVFGRCDAVHVAIRALHASTTVRSRTHGVRRSRNAHFNGTRCRTSFDCCLHARAMFFAC
eukprot:3902754-Lingulodinium_polyedra.AAC.1